VTATEVVLVGLEKSVFLLISRLAHRRDSLRLGHFDNNYLTLLASLSKSSLNIALQLLIVYNKNDATAETVYGIHQCFCLLLVVGREPVDDRSGSKELREHWLYHVRHLLHLVILSVFSHLSVGAGLLRI